MVHLSDWISGLKLISLQVMVIMSFLRYSLNSIKTRSRNAIKGFLNLLKDPTIEKGDVLNFNKRTGKLKIYVMISNGN